MTKDARLPCETGIYAIVHKASGKRYVGQAGKTREMAKDPEYRANHLAAMRKLHADPKFQAKRIAALRAAKRRGHRRKYKPKAGQVLLSF